MSLSNRTIHWTISCAVTLILLGTDVMACSCAATSICELVEQSDVIFLGEVIEGGLNPGEDAWSGRATSAKLRIIEGYKGLGSNIREVTVSLTYPPGMCSPNVYRRGERTLAFLRKPEGFGSLRDGACSGSRFAKDVPEHLQYVRDYFAGRTQSTIRGRVAANTVTDIISFVLDSSDGTPVEGAQIKAEGGGRSFFATTNARGEYTLVGLPPGSYRVSAEKAGYSKTEPEDPEPESFQVTLRARGCATQDLALWARNSVQGFVRDGAGNAVAGIRVFLQKVGLVDKYGEEAVTNGRGEFEFERVDPGRHYLTVSPFGATADSPYEPRFYGGASSRERAQVVNVEATSRLRSMNVQLGTRIAARKVRILTEWPDGKRVSNVFILCGDARIKSDDVLYFDSAQSEIADTPVCNILTDRPYRIRVTRLEHNMNLRDTPEVVIPAGRSDTEVRIRVGQQDAKASRR